MAAVFRRMGEQAGGGGERQTVRRVGIRADANPFHPASGRQRHVAPDAVAQDAIFILTDKPGRPAGPWRDREPRAILTEGEPAAFAGPVTRGIRGDEEAVSFRRIFWRCGDGGLDGELHDRIQPLQGFVVGDVFLCLGGEDIGKPKSRRLFRHDVPSALMCSFAGAL